MITGGSQGLGLAMAMHFASLQNHVYLLDIHPPQGKLSDNISYLQCDVTNRHQVTQISDTIAHVDILINNAGILRDASVFKMTDEQFAQVVDVHMKGTFLMTQIFAAKMKDAKSGNIINLSSVASQGNFGKTNYAGAKAGIIGMTKTWALELSRYNIRVNAIAPGLIETDMTASIPTEIRNTMIAKIPCQRMGQPSEIAHLAAFLASDDASYIQGQVIHINGGYYC
ncbi:MAG: SDR family oxidoreductase [Bdellovibrionota bacterium]